jgi:hypothetical protein
VTVDNRYVVRLDAPHPAMTRRRLIAYVACPVIGLALSTGLVALMGAGEAGTAFAAWAILAAALAAGLAALSAGGGRRSISSPEARAAVGRTAVLSALVTLALAAVAAAIMIAVFVIGCFYLPDEPCLR